MAGCCEQGNELTSILKRKKYVSFREGITKCSNEVYNKFTNIRQHNNNLLYHIGYMFRPVNR